jgi:hypothetical protein
MPAHTPRPADHHWRDTEGIPLPDRCRIEQLAVHQEHGALRPAGRPGRDLTGARVG